MDQNEPYIPGTQPIKRTWSSAKRYEYQGRMLTISMIAHLTGIPECTLRGRLRRLPTEQAFKNTDYRSSEYKPKKKSKAKRYKFNHQPMTRKEIQRLTGLPMSTINARIYVGTIKEWTDD